MPAPQHNALRLGPVAEPALLLLPGLLCLVFAFFLPVGLLVSESFLSQGPEGQSVFSLRHYARFFEGHTPPARATVQVAALPKGAKVEIDFTARVER